VWSSSWTPLRIDVLCIHQVGCTVYIEDDYPNGYGSCRRCHRDRVRVMKREVDTHASNMAPVMGYVWLLYLYFPTIQVISSHLILYRVANGRAISSAMLSNSPLDDGGAAVVNLHLWACLLWHRILATEEIPSSIPRDSPCIAQILPRSNKSTCVYESVI